jgi:hypothetical protein
MWRLSTDARNYFLTQPESGMGYQRVEIRRRWESAEPALLFNGELVIRTEDWLGTEGSDYSALVAEASELPEPFQVTLQGEPARYQVAEMDSLAVVPGRKVRSLAPFEGFVRFSAYPNDFRVLQGGGLAAGSFAAPVQELQVTHSGVAAVARFALPNPFPAVYVYPIVPKGATLKQIEVGTVTPAFGQAGGGVEVRFLSALVKGSVVGPYRIPEI